jgi:hypothetical protein
MDLSSWFNSSNQVDTALVYVAVIGAVIEVGVAIAAVINVHKELGESRKEKLEKYIEVFACLAAFFFLAEAILGCRSSMLLGKDLETLRSDNLKHEQRIEELRHQNDELEAKTKWREITPGQKRDFIESTKGISKFAIRVRYGTPDAEVQSFAKMIRDMLDSAGFTETNVPALQEWPPGMNMLYIGGSRGEMPSVSFLTNIEVTNKDGNLQSVPNAIQSKINADRPAKVFYAFPEGKNVAKGFIEAEQLLAIIAQTNSVSQTNYSYAIPAHSTFSCEIMYDREVETMLNLIKIRQCFDAIGITASWSATTNLQVGTCEIFINPKF